MLGKSGLLSMSSSGKTELFLTRNQIINNKNKRNFLCVESINRQNSSFTINLHSENQANLKIRDVYTYYIFGSENKNMHKTQIILSRFGQKVYPHPYLVI